MAAIVGGERTGRRRSFHSKLQLVFFVFLFIDNTVYIRKRRYIIPLMNTCEVDALKKLDDLSFSMFDDNKFVLVHGLITVFISFIDQYLMHI